MTIWFVAAAVVLIVELFIGTVYLLVVSVALAAAGIMYGLSSHFFCRCFDRGHHQRTRYLAGTRPSEKPLGSPSAQR